MSINLRNTIEEYEREKGGKVTVAEADFPTVLFQMLEIDASGKVCGCAFFTNLADCKAAAYKVSKFTHDRLRAAGITPPSPNA